MAAEKKWVSLDTTESEGELIANQVYSLEIDD